MTTIKIDRNWVFAFALLAGLASAVWLATPARSAEPEGDEDTRKRTKKVVLMDEGDRHAYVGVEVREEVDDGDGGARVTQVVPDSPADEAGIEAGDIITRFGGESVRGPASLTARIRSHEPGERVKVQVLRDGEEKTLDVELGSRGTWARMFETPEPPEPPEAPEPPMPPEEWSERLNERLKKLDYGELRYLTPGTHLFEMWRRPRLGVQLVEITPELRQHLGAGADAGILVSKVLRDTPAQRAGIKVGDVIVSVAGNEITSADELREALEEQDGTFSIGLVRDRRSLTVEVTSEQPEEDKPTGPRAALVPYPAPPQALAPRALPGPTPRPVAAPRSPVAPPRPPAPPAPAPLAPLPPPPPPPPVAVSAV